LGNFGDGSVVGTPVNRPKISGFGRELELNRDGTLNKNSVEYFELQFHGGVKISNIEKVLIPENYQRDAEYYPDVRKFLDRLNVSEIPYETYVPSSRW
jgi:hypothetical protein